MVVVVCGVGEEGGKVVDGEGAEMLEKTELPQEEMMTEGVRCSLCLLLHLVSPPHLYRDDRDGGGQRDEGWEVVGRKR